ncbi:MAG: zeta toxin family protein [Zetaproteobacteria bacterium]|nr:zeta toxin family protein [Zetaproteobacteria bacterium]
MSKKVIIIAGPNGAGKTTFAMEFLPYEASCPVFVNADLIAAGMSPFQPRLVAVAAARLMLQQIQIHVDKGESFAFETTLSGRGYLRSIKIWQTLGYTVKLFFLRLPSVQFAQARVKQRVLQGGHFVADEVIARRFQKGLNNFYTLYQPLVDEWSVYDTSNIELQRLGEGSRDEITE